MEKKAKFIGVASNRNPLDRHAWEHTELVYSYRGHEYIVTKDNNGYMGTPMWVQHKEEQERIDRMIEQQGKPIPAWKYEGSAQEGFDVFWEYVEAENDSQKNQN